MGFVDWCLWLCVFVLLGWVLGIFVCSLVLLVIMMVYGIRDMVKTLRENPTKVNCFRKKGYGETK